MNRADLRRLSRSKGGGLDELLRIIRNAYGSEVAKTIKTGTSDEIYEITERDLPQFTLRDSIRFLRNMNTIKQFQQFLQAIGKYNGIVHGLFTSEFGKALIEFIFEFKKASEAEKENNQDVDSKLNTEDAKFKKYLLSAGGKQKKVVVKDTVTREDVLNGSKAVALNDSGEFVRSVQEIFKKLNYPVNRPNGHFNSKYEHAVKIFQEKRNLPVTGVIDAATLSSLEEDAKNPEQNKFIKIIASENNSQGTREKNGGNNNQVTRMLYLANGKKDNVVDLNSSAVIHEMQEIAKVKGLFPSNYKIMTGYWDYETKKALIRLKEELGFDVSTDSPEGFKLDEELVNRARAWRNSLKRRNNTSVSKKDKEEQPYKISKVGNVTLLREDYIKCMDIVFKICEEYGFDYALQEQFERNCFMKGILSVIEGSGEFLGKEDKLTMDELKDNYQFNLGRIVAGILLVSCFKYEMNKYSALNALKTYGIDNLLQMLLGDGKTVNFGTFLENTIGGIDVSLINRTWGIYDRSAANRIVKEMNEAVKDLRNESKIADVIQLLDDNGLQRYYREANENSIIEHEANRLIELYRQGVKNPGIGTRKLQRLGFENDDESLQKCIWYLRGTQGARVYFVVMGEYFIELGRSRKNISGNKDKVADRLNEIYPNIEVIAERLKKKHPDLQFGSY